MKKYILLIFCAGLLGVYYFIPVSDPNGKIPESLLLLNQLFIGETAPLSELKDDYWMNDLRYKDLTSVEKKIIKWADDAGINRIIFNQKPPYSLAYYPDNYFYYLTDRYYVYASDDYTEEAQVPSVEQAIERLEDKSIYHFCEPTDHPHWFLCVSQD